MIVDDWVVVGWEFECRESREGDVPLNHNHCRDRVETRRELKGRFRVAFLLGGAVGGEEGGDGAAEGEVGDGV